MCALDQMLGQNRPGGTFGTVQIVRPVVQAYGNAPRQAPVSQNPRLSPLQLTPMVRQGVQQQTVNQIRAVKLGD